MFNSSSKKWLSASGAGVAAVLLMAAPAKSSEYSCRVPRALLCEGCASHIAIALQANGACRISFSPDAVATHEPSPAAAPIEFTVDVPPAPVVVAPRRASWRAHYVGLARPAAAAHCFVFNAQQYCE
jgi:hypothetical protein